jgi:uncharacterized membrane protein
MLKPIGAIAGVGAAVVGVSWLYRALRRRFVSRHRGNLGINVETSITIKESRERLYRFWRNFENLPHVMSHLESVRVTGPTRSHWTMKASAGVRLEWDAEIINDLPNELIAWRSVANSDVTHAGSVRFEPTAGGASIVRVTLQYDPPGGELGHVLAALFGSDARQTIDGDLDSFKTSMERGAIADAVSW